MECAERGISRRVLLQASGLAGAAVLSASLPAVLAAQAGTPTPSWVDRPMRWGQLTLVENDPGKFDPQFWLDYFRDTHCDAVCLSAGGCVAYYPTNVRFHHRGRWLAETDPFGQLVQGCRKLGMVVIARVDPHATYDDARLAHSDWIAVDAEGRPRRHWSYPEMWVTCGLGPYNFEFMNEVIKEVVGRYRVDGIFINRWDGSGMCYCEHCRRNFKAATGLELPRTSVIQDPARRAYVLWRQERLFALWRLWDGEVRRINPDAFVIPNTGGGASSALDMKRIGELAPMLCADRQARSGLAAPWLNGKNAKEYRAALGSKPIVGIFSVGLEEQPRWKDSVQSAAEIRVWVADGIAQGFRPWFTKFSGVLHDKRWLKVVQDIYNWHHSAEKYLRNEENLARVALVYSQQTAWFCGANVEQHGHGWYQALIEARIPFEMVHDRLLDADRVKSFKTLILPNIAALSEAQCGQLADFVAAGGGLVATYETSLYDEQGNKRRDFGLADLFGVAFQGRSEGPMRNSYLRPETDPATGKRHPILAGLEDASRIINGLYRLDVRATGPLGHIPLTLIPSYPDLPMEQVYPRVEKTDIPAVYARQHGRGRVLYFPWDIDRSFWEFLCVDHGRLLGNAVEWASDEAPPVRVVGPGVLDVAAWRQKNSLTVHLVNLSNPMMMKGPIRELLPIGPQQVMVRIPEGTRASRIQLLVAGRAPEARQEGRNLHVTVPSILDHEVVAIDL